MAELVVDPGTGEKVICLTGADSRFFVSTRNYSGNYLSSLTPAQRSAELSRRVRKYLAELTPEQVKSRMKGSCRSSEGIRHSAEANRRSRSLLSHEEAWERDRERALKGWKGMSEETRRSRSSRLSIKKLREWRDGKYSTEVSRTNLVKAQEANESARSSRLRGVSLSLGFVDKYYQKAVSKSRMVEVANIYESSYLSQGLGGLLELFSSREASREYLSWGKHREAMRAMWRNSSVPWRASRGLAISRGQRGYWDSLSAEERAVRAAFSRANLRKASMVVVELLRDEDKKREWLRRSLHSDVAVRRMIESLHRRPTIPELCVLNFLNSRFSGLFVYNGDFRGGVRIGGRIPDFVHVGGCRKVIEVFGVYWHPLEDESQRIEQYWRNGYECLVLWEYEAYSPKVLDKKVSEFMRQKEMMSL